MTNMRVLQGKIVKLGNIFVDVELYHIEPKQTISALVIMPMFINAKEQEMNIKNGTEVMLLGWGADGLDNFLVLGSSANGIEVGGLGITKIENLKEVKIIAPKITISNNAGDREDITQEDKQAESFYVWAKEATTLAENTTITSEKKTEINSENATINIRKKTKIKTHTIKIDNEAGFEIVSLLSDLMSNVIKLEAKHGMANTIPLKAKLETFK